MRKTTRMKRLLPIAALFAFVTTAQAQTLKDFMNQVHDYWTAPTEPFRVIGNVYWVGTKGIGSYLITGPEGHVLLDTALPESTGLIKANIEKLGFKISDIKLILNSHAHFDHTGGLAEMKAATGAPLVAGVKDKPLLESGTYPGQDDAELRFPPVKVDRTVSDGDVMRVGPIVMTAHATPGHSPGCTTWTMPVVEKGEPHGVIFFCSATVALNRLVGAPTYPGIIDDYRMTFAQAPKIAGDVFLTPHAEMFDLEKKRAAMTADGPNPFVKRGEFQDFVDGLAKAFDGALAKQQAAILNAK